tara:strand:+ start:14600 stop:15724 length:1125 start_codon:yes stop_codon:yes gene_type:complete
MAYQNVGTPRFIIDWIQWWRSLGLAYGSSVWNASAPFEENEQRAIDKLISLDPTTQTIVTNVGDHVGGDYFNYLIGTTKPFPVDLINIVGILGHNFANIPGSRFSYSFHNGTGYPYIKLTEDIVINDALGTQKQNSMYPIQNGFTLRSSSGSTDGTPVTGGGGLQPNLYDIGEYVNSEIKLGSFLAGRYYDLPHSPELNLTMTNEMDGVKRSRTKAGADIVNYRYTKSPMWGDLSPWELHDPTNPTALDYQKMSRVGRRVWDLSFNYLSASDLNPVTEGVSKKITDPDAFDNEAGNPIWSTGAGTHHNIMESDDFYSQVIHKTNGGALPFIFQPDNNNNNPDQFAICRLDMKSFVFDQVANGVYNVKLKIREVW